MAIESSANRFRSTIQPKEIGEHFGVRQLATKQRFRRPQILDVGRQLDGTVRNVFEAVGTAVLVIDEVDLP